MKKLLWSTFVPKGRVDLQSFRMRSLRLKVTHHGNKDMCLSELTAQCFNFQRLRSKASPIHPSFPFEPCARFFHPAPPPQRLCRNHDGEWIPTESRPGGIRFFSFRMRSFKVMGNRPCWKQVSFHGLGTPTLSDERFPPCLRPARRDYAQAGLKLHHPTACSVLKQK